MEPDSDKFVGLLTASQPALYACILAILPDRLAAHDVLQETNLTLWRKADDFEPGTNFLAWASRIARYHVLNHRRKLRRDRLVFDEGLFAELCERQAARADDASRYAEALRQCLGKLQEDQRKLVEERYSPGGSVKKIAESRVQTVGAVSQMLYRIREGLMNCITRSLGEVTS